jgi:hypothetical protein
MKVLYALTFLSLCFMIPSVVLFGDDYTVQWADTVDNGDWDGATDVAVDHSCNIVVVGTSFINGNNDYFIVKYDSSGTILWQDTLDNGNEDYGEAVAVDNGDNIIVTGYSMIGGDYDYFIVKYDPGGTVLWQDILDNGGLYDIARGVAVDHRQNIIVTGYCDIGGDCVFYTVKYDSSGTLLWADTLDYGPFDSGFDVAVDYTNSIAVTGYTTSGINNDYLTVKYDSSGTLLWQDAMDIYEFDQAYGVAVDNSNSIIVTGCAGGPFDDYDFVTVKYDSSGTILWVDTLDYEDSDDVVYDVCTDDQNALYMTGYSLRLSGGYDYYTVKYDSSGTLLWQNTLDNGNHDISYGVAVDGRDHLIVTGRSHIGGDFDYYTVRYAPVQGISGRGEVNTPSGEIECLVSPNPFSSATTITIERLSENQNIRESELIIYDATGRRVREISLLPFSFCLEAIATWDGRDGEGNLVSPGVYYLTIETEGYRETKKLIFVR